MLLHSTHKHLGDDTTQATVIILNSLLESWETGHKVKLICVDNDLAPWHWPSANGTFPYASAALGSFKFSVFGSAALTLLAVHKLLVTWRSQCQQRVGVFFSSEGFCMKCPSCIPASRWPTGLADFQFHPGATGYQHWCYVLAHIKRDEFSTSQLVGNFWLHLAYFQTFLFYHGFASTAVFISSFLA